MSEELAGEMGRLADAAEKLLRRAERVEREQRDEHLRREWGPSMPKLDVALFLRSIPGLAELFDRVVPSEFVAQTDAGEFTVACPCSKDPVIRHRRLTGCECGRWFLHDGTNIRVALTPKGPGEATAGSSGPTPD